LEEFGTERTPLAHVSSPLWRCYSIWGFEGLMELLADRPDLVLHACERFLAQSRASVRCAATLGARLVWIEECLTDTISPAAFESINLRFLCALVEEIRSHGLRSVYYYCGNPNDRLRLLLAAGADALALEESKKGFRIDIAAVASAVQGRCVLLGNLDAMHLLAHADEKELRQEIDRQVTAGRMNRGRFIMSLGSPVTPHTPIARVQRYCELAHELGR
ncbi:MAG TPA: uroporphyrinogen decarboxylase family protein, partial [Phycisphaerae bacterium]|nr:uroporphyrinogen decarboxylase family protein [Phycisphaerae bacterium]